MGRFLGNRDGGKTDELGHNFVLKKAFTGNVVSGFTTTQAGTPALSVEVAAGQALIEDGDKKYEVWADSTQTVTISTPNVSNPRKDYIVAYVDTTETPNPASPNNPTIFKFAAVAGTPAGSPSAPSSGQIQSAIGAANPYAIIAEVLVGAGVTTITNANITDRRTMVGINLDNIKETKSNSFILYDADGNEYVKLSKVASAVNELTLKNAATGNAPEIQATGGDANIDLSLLGKGTGTVKPKMGYTDANGWDVLDFVTHKIAFKSGSITGGSRAAGATWSAGNTGNLPVGCSTVADIKCLNYSFRMTGNAFALGINMEGGTSSASVGWTAINNAAGTVDFGSPEYWCQVIF